MIWNRGLGVAIVCALVAWWGGVAMGQDLPPKPNPALAPPKEMDPRTRDQLFSFLPYISMYNDLTLGKNGVADVLLNLTELRDAQDKALDSHPTLQLVVRRVYSKLVPWEAQVGNAVRNQATPITLNVATDDPGWVLAIGLVQAAIAYNKIAAYESWQRTYDLECRQAYKELMDIVRKVAKGKDLKDNAVRVRVTFEKRPGVFLYATNETGRTLHNVTLEVTLRTLDGTSSVHYYFVPEWSAERSKYAMRLASDWLPAEATSKAVVELVSDEVIAKNIECALDDNVPTAAKFLLDDIALQVGRRYRLKYSIDRLENMDGTLGGYPEHGKRCAELLKTARKSLETIIDDLEKRKKATEDAMSKNTGKHYSDSRQQAWKKELVQIEKTIQEYRGGRK